ncbi:hypothetical protein ZWY2020_055281 [Hordeum vulgare]|nr:hypothetical protein ZWY2020_055281 [Hordeum vulgare]
MMASLKRVDGYAKVELMKQSSCSMQLTNKTDHYVAFKSQNYQPKAVLLANIGVVLPGSTCDVTVTMQAEEAPPDLQCKDKFLVQSVAAENGAATQDITAAMFNKEPGRLLMNASYVIYVPTSTPSSLSEESEQGVFRPSGELSKDKSLEIPFISYLTFMATSMISKLTEEKMSAVQQNQKLRQELDVLKRAAKQWRFLNHLLDCGGYSGHHRWFHPQEDIGER